LLEVDAIKLEETPFLKDKPLLIILFTALIVRLIIMLFYPDQLFPDAQAYKTIGKEIFSGSIITNNIYMPLYPILSFITGGGKIQILTDIFLSVISIWLIFSISIVLFKDRLMALLSSIIGALYPHFVFYSVSGLTEVFFTFLILLSFLLFYKNKIVWAMIFSIFALLVKPSLDFFNPILVVIFIIIVHKMQWKVALKYLGIYFLSYVVIMSPWWIHQYQKYDSFVRLSLGDGIVLYAGNNPLNFSGGGISGVDFDDSHFEVQDPIIRNITLKNAAFEYILSNPGHFVKMSLVKLTRLWRLWPYAQEYSQWYIVVLSLLSYGMVLLMALGFMVRYSKKYFRNTLPILALFAYITLVHMISIGSIRYRFPLEPFLIIFASYFMIDNLKNKQWFIYIIRIFKLIE
jgi:4-amino-4-deoxy-L-arabinose transferase-like glycosyltransferase